MHKPDAFPPLTLAFLYGVVMPFMAGVFQFLAFGQASIQHLLMVSVAGILAGMVHGGAVMVARSRKTAQKAADAPDDRSIRASRRGTARQANPAASASEKPGRATGLPRRKGPLIERRRRP